jgi:hypothetical protein
MLHGESFAAHLSEQENRQTRPRNGREAVYAMFVDQSQRAIRARDHKMIISFTHRKRSEVPADLAHPRSAPGYPGIELFDLQDDPLETINRFDDPAYRAAGEELLSQLWAWMESVDDPVLKGPLREPYYEQMHARYRSWRGTSE